MPRFCRVKARQISEDEIISKLLENVCESVIPWLGIDPGMDQVPWFSAPWNAISSFTNLSSCWFQAITLLLATTAAFMLGVYIRRRTIINLLQQKEEWIDKEKMLLNQLWAALEEKLENKSQLQESRNELDKLKVELDGERAEKESIQSRIWGLQRNVKLIQSERDVLEEKMKDAISTFSGVQNSLNKKDGQMQSSDVAACKSKIKDMQGLMQKLIEVHRKDHQNFVSMLERGSTC